MKKDNTKKLEKLEINTSILLGIGIVMLVVLVIIAIFTVL